MALLVLACEGQVGNLNNVQIIAKKEGKNMTTSVRLMLNKGRRLNNGTYPLVFQVIHSRRKKLLYTGFRLKEEAFNEAEEKIVDGTDATLTATDITKMNRELRKMKNMIHTRIRQLERTTEPFTVEDVLAQFTRANVRQQFYILRYIDTQIERKKKLKKEGTAAAYKSTRSSLAKFLVRTSGCQRLIYVLSGAMRIFCIIMELPKIR